MAEFYSARGKTNLAASVDYFCTAVLILSIFGLKRLLRQFTDQSAAQNAALLDEFRMITLALHEEAKRSESSEDSPAKNDTRPPAATLVHPATPAPPATPTTPATPLHPSRK